MPSSVVPSLYVFDASVDPWASRDAAVAAAARNVLVPLIEQIPAPFPPECLQAGLASVEADYATAIGAIRKGAAKTRGIRLGRAAAAAILALRARDGSDTALLDFDYPQGTEPGEYRFTPGFNFVFAPGWADVTPFVLERSSQFRPNPPYRLRSKKYTADFNEVKALGSDDISTPSARTPDQTEIALFWLESSPLQWNRIARTASASARLDAWENARLFGLLNLALADGYISSFEAKRHFNFWRPVTAIQLADSDGNAKTIGVANWTPLAPTPPITDHDSGHSVQGGAAAEVLKRFFGTDHVSFSTCSLTLPESTCDSAVRCVVPTRASRRRPTRTDSHGFWSDFTSGTPSKKASSMAGRSAGAPSDSSCGRPIDAGRPPSHAMPPGVKTSGGISSACRAPPQSREERLSRADDITENRRRRPSVEDDPVRGCGVKRC